MDASSQPSWSKTMPVDALVRTVVANSLVDQVTEEIRSSIVTGISRPVRRVPTAPEEMTTPSLKTAAASAGRPNSFK